MLCFRICRKCQLGEYHEEQYGEDGKMAVMPSVLCHKHEEELLMNSDLPDGCPYQLEHLLSCQDIPQKLADMVSGGLPLKPGDES